VGAAFAANYRKEDGMSVHSDFVSCVALHDNPKVEVRNPG